MLQDGFGFLRSPEANYLPGPDDIYVSPSQIRRFGLRTGDTVEGQIRAPKRRRALFRPAEGQHRSTSRSPESVRHRINFDNLTPLYPDERLKMEIDDPTHEGPDRPGSSTSSPRSARASAPDRRAAAHRQDGDAAEHRPLDRAPTIPKCYLIVLLIDERPGRSHRHGSAR